MAKGSKGTRPIIVKKVKKKGGGHHGGSWKVAYADFVTAMMAFFLLLWLLGSVEEDTRVGIASYFQRPMTAITTMGNHAGGDRLAPTSEGSEQNGILSPGNDAVSGRVDSLRIARLQEELEAEILTNPVLEPFKDQLRFELTERGLRIQIMDKDDVPMFEAGSAAMKSYASDLLREIARVLNEVPNQLIISGHTDTTPYPGGEGGYSNWELSADRANAARRALSGGGIPAGKVARVEGLASTELLYRDAPDAPANRRISILLLNRRTQVELHLQEASTPGIVSP